MSNEWVLRDYSNRPGMKQAFVFTVVKYYFWLTVIFLHKQCFPADKIMHNPDLSRAACRVFAMKRNWENYGN